MILFLQYLLTIRNKRSDINADKVDMKVSTFFYAKSKDVFIGLIESYFDVVKAY